MKFYVLKYQNIVTSLCRYLYLHDILYQINLTSILQNNCETRVRICTHRIYRFTLEVREAGERQLVITRGFKACQI